MSGLTKISGQDLLQDLARHQHIGWDIDETLYLGPSSLILHSFIKEHPEIEHSVVTHRTYGYGYVFEDLARYKRSLKPKHFLRVHMYDDDRWDEYHEVSIARIRRIYNGPLLPIEIHYAEWKPRTCLEYGMTALVDDRIDLLAIPCQQLGIELYDPRDFVCYSKIKEDIK